MNEKKRTTTTTKIFEKIVEIFAFNYIYHMLLTLIYIFSFHFISFVCFVFEIRIIIIVVQCAFVSWFAPCSVCSQLRTFQFTNILPSVLCFFFRFRSAFSSVNKIQLNAAFWLFDRELELTTLCTMYCVAEN